MHLRQIEVLWSFHDGKIPVRRHKECCLQRGESPEPKDKKQPPPDDPGNPTVNFRGEKRSNQTHESKTDAEALLAKYDISRLTPADIAALVHRAGIDAQVLT